MKTTTITQQIKELPKKKDDIRDKLLPLPAGRYLSEEERNRMAKLGMQPYTFNIKGLSHKEFCSFREQIRPAIIIMIAPKEDEDAN